MEKRVQYKFQVSNSFIDDAEDKGIAFSLPVEHTYTYFEVLRDRNAPFMVLRLKESLGVQKLDMKIRTDKTGEWEHFESGVGNGQHIQAILERLGCKPIFTFHKHRSTWQNKIIRFDLDTTKELGTFLEVKFDLKVKANAEQFLRDLGVDPKSHDKRSVIEIYLEKYRHNQ